jgi:hypothetical protein
VCCTYCRCRLTCSKNVTRTNASVMLLTTGTDKHADRMVGDQSTRDGKEHIVYTRYDLTSDDRGGDGGLLCVCSSPSAYTLFWLPSMNRDVVTTAPAAKPRGKSLLEGALPAGRDAKERAR